jgi:hypothetical protein
MMICHCADPLKGTDLLRPLRALKPEVDNVQIASYLETQATINPYTPVAYFQTDGAIPIELSAFEDSSSVCNIELTWEAWRL